MGCNQSSPVQPLSSSYGQTDVTPNVVPAAAKSNTSKGRRASRRAPTEDATRMSDGLTRPTTITALKPFFPSNYRPADDLKTVLRKLPPSQFPTHVIDQLFRSYEEFCAKTTFPDDDNLLESDRFALFTYAFELKDIGASAAAITSLQGEELSARLREFAKTSEVEVEEEVLAEITRSHVSGSALHPDTSPQLSELLQWIRSPAADPSWSFQIYKSISASMRGFIDGGDTEIETFRDVIFHITSALAKLEAKSAVVFRGIGGVQLDVSRYAPGLLVAFPGFSSTSISPKVASEFLGKHKSGVMFLIHTHIGKSIGPYSPFPAEQELVLLPQASFRVKGVASVGIRQLMGVPPDVQVIEMVQLPDDELEAEQIAARAVELYNDGNYTAHDELLEEAYRKFPNTVGGLYAIGSMHGFGSNPNLKLALEYFTKVLMKEPDHLLCLCDYGAMLMQLGDIPSAELNFRKALTVDPNHTATLSWMVSLLSKQPGREAEAKEIKEREKLSRNFKNV
eukprot:RCo051754